LRMFSRRQEKRRTWTDVDVLEPGRGKMKTQKAQAHHRGDHGVMGVFWSGAAVGGPGLGEEAKPK
jgi:hypothetical protein